MRYMEEKRKGEGNDFGDGRGRQGRSDHVMIKGQVKQATQKIKIGRHSDTDTVSNVFFLIANRPSLT